MYSSSDAVIRELSQKSHYDISDLLAIMRSMRDKESGCAWTQGQSFDSLTVHTLEEAYELVNSIEKRDYDELKGELGDLLNQIIFYAEIAKENQLFDFADIVDFLSKKLIARHPDVFADGKVDDYDELEKQWQLLKRKEREKKAQKKANASLDNMSILEDIAENLPSLSYAQKLQTRAQSVGFDWKNTADVLQVLKAEITELEEAIKVGDIKEMHEELGDVVFSCVNLSRHLKADAEQLLRQANSKFKRRFMGVESALKEKGIAIETADLDLMEALWQLQKEHEHQAKVKS